MATKRKSVRRVSNPRRRVSAVVRHVKRSNPRRRRNPEVRGLVTKATYAVIGAALTRGISNWIPITGPYASVGVQLGVAYALGVAAEKLAHLQKDKADSIAAGGAAVAIGSLIDQFVPSFTSGQFLRRPAMPNLQALVPASAAAAAPGVGDFDYLNDIIEYDGVSDIVEYQF